MDDLRPTPVARRAGRAARAGSGRAALLVVALLVLGACGGPPGTAGPATGTVAPRTLAEVSVVPLGGGQAEPLGAVDGRPTVVNIWAPWCTPCLTEMPAFEQVARAQNGRVAFVGVTEDADGEAAASVAATTGVTYPLYQVRDGDLAGAVGLTGLPATVFLAADGTVLDVHAGALTAESLTEALERHYGPA